MESLLSSLGVMAREKASAVDEAQDLMYDAWEATTKKQRVALAKKAIEISADCADAYVLLAEETARSLEEAMDLYRKGVEAGERALGKEVFKEEVGYFWGLLETRPYMRARLGLAQCMWGAGDREEAIEHYWDMLRLNPNDNQGIRDLLMPSLLELGRDKDAEKLFRQYKEDGMVVWMYSKALLDFRKHGPSPIADKSLKAAMKENKHVPAYLLGRRWMPPYLPALYGFGDENEAVVFVHGNETAWKATPGALEWLAAKVK
jgi:tetratricopeptide (TPR) repeat protein